MDETRKEIAAVVDALGGQNATARLLRDKYPKKYPNIRQGHVWRWLNLASELPPQYVNDLIALAAECGYEARAHLLCPSTFENPEAAPV